MTIEERVENAFKEDVVDSDELRNYLAELRVNWRQAESALSRTISLILLAGAVFELITRGAMSEVSLGFVKITSATPLIAATLPVISAYLTLNLAMSIEDVTLYGHAHSYILRTRFKSLYENCMEVPLQPPVRFAVGPRFYFDGDTFVNRLGCKIITYGRGVIYLLTPVALVVYPYFRLLTTRGSGDTFIWLSLSISTFLLVSAILVFLDLNRWS